MRISSGTAKGVRLRVPPGARPTSERVRQAILSSLAPHLPGARVLDLYCGSGAYGLEALSRGAASAVFVDRSPAAIAAARDNARACGFRNTEFHRRDVARYEPGPDGPFDLVFVDPPYAQAPNLANLVAGLNAGRVVIEGGRRMQVPDAVPGFLLEADRKYGDTRVLVYRRLEDDMTTAEREARSKRS